LVHGTSITSLHASVPPSLVPLGIYAEEIFDPGGGEELSLELGTELTPGIYAVRLYMGNGYFGTNQPGQRFFNIAIEEESFLTNVDLASSFGPDAGGVFEWSGAVKDGSVTVDFGHVLENPLINAAEVVLLEELPNTPFVSVIAPAVNEADGSLDLVFQSDILVPETGPVTIDFEVVGLTATPEV
ncbi:MAG: malectin domain-containing carbohydrate-binding protein, partial [Pseudomonadota bacterium]